MSSGSKAVKKTSLTTLKANLLPLLFSGIILIFAYFCCNLTSSLFIYARLDFFANIIFIILLFFLFIPLLFGYLRFSWRIILGVTDNCISVFYYFSSLKKYFRIIKMELTFLFKAFLRGIVFFIPALFVKLISQEFFYKFFDFNMPLWIGNLGPIFNGLLSFALVMLIFLMLKFYMAPMLIVADENMENSEAIYMSDLISKKSGIDFIFLFISFLGWIILSYFVFPLVFTLPYMILSYLYHCRFAVAEYNKHIEKLNNNNLFAEGI